MKMAMNNVTSAHPLEAVDDLDKDEYFYSIKKRIYQSAKEGFSLNLQVLISRVESVEIRNVLVNQVSLSSDLSSRIARKNGKFSQSSSSRGRKRAISSSQRFSLFRVISRLF